MNTINCKKIFINGLVIMLLFSCVIFPEVVFNSAKEGLILWFQAVLPSLFPFVVCINLLVALDILKYCDVIFRPIMNKLFNLPGSTAFVWVSGVTSGYPVGAKLSAQMYKKGEITLNQAQHLLAFCNNSGPLFILGTIGVGMLTDQRLGYLLLIAHIASSIFCGLISRNQYSMDNKQSGKKKIKIDSRKRNIDRSNRSNHQLDIGELLGNSVSDAMALMVQIGGFIIIFSVILNLLKIYGVPMLLAKLSYPILKFLGLNIEIIEALLLGTVEITNGIKVLVGVNADISVLLSGISFLVAWSGFSIHAQTASVIKDTPLKFSKYMGAKAFQGLVAATITYWLIPIWIEDISFNPQLIFKGLILIFVLTLMSGLKLKKHHIMTKGVVYSKPRLE